MQKKKKRKRHKDKESFAPHAIPDGTEKYKYSRCKIDQHRNDYAEVLGLHFQKAKQTNKDYVDIANR